MSKEQASNMRIGVFDSGLGGLFILYALTKNLPDFDYVYLGDTARVPYGNRSQEQIYTFTKQAVDYLFQNNCQLIILACNSASAQALRKIQQQYLPKKYPNRRVLGVIIPTAESVINFRKIGILATTATVKSKSFEREIKKINPGAQIFAQSAPQLVPIIESDHFDELEKYLKIYLQPILAKKVEAIILGCTHYPIIKKQIQKIAGSKIKIISQTDIVPTKLKNYLVRHPEISTKLSKNHKRTFLATKISPTLKKQAKLWFGSNVKFSLVEY